MMSFAGPDNIGQFHKSRQKSKLPSYSKVSGFAADNVDDDSCCQVMREAIDAVDIIPG